MNKTRAQRRREERLRKKGYGTYEDALDMAVQSHRKKTNCPCISSIGIPVTDTTIEIVCGDCHKKIGTLDGRKDVWKE